MDRLRSSRSWGGMGDKRVQNVQVGTKLRVFVQGRGQDGRYGRVLGGRTEKIRAKGSERSKKPSKMVTHLTR